MVRGDCQKCQQKNVLKNFKDRCSCLLLSGEGKCKHRAVPELLHLCCLTCRGFKNKTQEHNCFPLFGIFTPQCCSYHFLLYLFRHITVTLVIIILLTWLFLITLYPLAMARSLLHEFRGFLWVFVPVCTLSHELQLVSFSTVFSFFFWTHTDFITMLPWKRGGSHNPHKIYSRGRNNCFNFFFFDVVYIYFFHFGGFCKKKRALYCLTIVLFEMCPPFLSGRLCLSSHVHLDGELSLQRRDWDFCYYHGENHLYFCFSSVCSSSFVIKQ